MNDIDFADIHSVHFVGIKGIAMTALAIWAKERGISVTGSDVHEVFPSDPMLRAAGISVFEGFKTEHLNRNGKPDLVVYTGAHGGIDNIEVQEAKKQHIPVLPHGIALGTAMHSKRQISVAGSHGKTTTSSMIATILMYAGKDPSYAIGCGEIAGLGMPGHFGRGDYFVAEADEYVTDPTHDPTPRFLWQHPDIFAVTNIDFDHPDAYKTLSDVQDAFVRLSRQQTGMKLMIVNADDPASAPLLDNPGHSSLLTYGSTETAGYRIENIVCSGHKTGFALNRGGKTIAEFSLNIPGRHNIYNATLAAISAHAAGIPWNMIAEGLSRFGGAKRRFEFLGKRSNILFYDDYAHHPKEVNATITSAREWFTGHRIIVVFQPHTYSRTQTLMHEFSRAFTAADTVLISQIYASAREKDTLGIDGSTLVSEIAGHHADVTYVPTADLITARLKKICKKGDIVLFMGAGDIYTWEKSVMDAF